MHESNDNGVDKAIEAILAARAQRLRQSVSQESANYQEVIVFTLSGERYAVALDELSEIKKVRNLTVLPGVNSAIAGVINVRGSIVSLYQLAPRELPDDAGTMFALVGADDAAHIAIVADTIIGTEKVTADDISAVPLSLQEKAYITGIGHDSLVFVSLRKLLQQPTLYIA